LPTAGEASALSRGLLVLAGIMRYGGWSCTMEEYADLQVSAPVQMFRRTLYLNPEGPRR